MGDEGVWQRMFWRKQHWCWAVSEVRRIAELQPPPWTSEERIVLGGVWSVNPTRWPQEVM